MEKKLKFEELEISNNLKRALEEAGYIETTPIQEQTIPVILEGKDIIGQSQTGTGKTAAYGLPAIEKIDKNLKSIQTIILAPTRELAIQITGELRKFTKYEDGVKCLSIYGGESIERQIKSLKSGIKIVVGTPGRIMDHMRRKTLKLDDIRMVVLDEADEMLNMGFEEDIQTILSEVPEERQTVLFSATMNKRILDIAKKYLTKPVSVKIEAKQLTVDKIEQIGIEVKQSMKDETVMRLIEVNNPNKAVIFCNTKRKVDELIEILKKNGYKAESLHGDIKQIQRQYIMEKLKRGDIQILVATDVVARGIDVDNLELVINYDIPQEEEYYVHRIGRTGRNGNSGKAYTFIGGKEKGKILRIEKYANTKILYGKIPTAREMDEAKAIKIVNKIQKIIDNEKETNNELNNEILEKLLEANSIETIAKALLETINSKKVIKISERSKIEREDREDRKTRQSKSGKSIKSQESGYIKLFLSVGKKDGIQAKDIVGSFTANTEVSGEEIGKIKVLDNFSFVEIPEQFQEDIMETMNDKKIKGKEFNIEIAKA
ncbi:MAG: DEAD/DEAH box helicase [Clostridiaceae bacterium]|nr:DEAD/DEAH box helicase [Clostridiaceae bacterium]